MRLKTSSRAAFTLIELLVVIGIIAVLVSVAVPAINRGLDSGNAARCAGNLRQLGFGVQRFAADNNGYLVKGWFNQGPNYPSANDTSWGYPASDWAGWDRVLLDYLEQGTVAPNGKRVYTEKSAALCRCPADRTKGNVFSNYLNGVGSIPNSYRFNASMQELGQERAVKLIGLPSPSKLILIADGVFKSYHHVRLTDAVESGKISRANSNNIAATRHSGAANYLFADGHVERLKWEETWDRTTPGADPAWGLWKQKR